MNKLNQKIEDLGFRPIQFKMPIYSDKPTDVMARLADIEKRLGILLDVKPEPEEEDSEEGEENGQVD